MISETIAHPRGLKSNTEGVMPGHFYMILFIRTFSVSRQAQGGALITSSRCRWDGVHARWMGWRTNKLSDDAIGAQRLCDSSEAARGKAGFRKRLEESFDAFRKTCVRACCSHVP